MLPGSGTQSHTQTVTRGERLRPGCGGHAIASKYGRCLAVWDSHCLVVVQHRIGDGLHSVGESSTAKHFVAGAALSGLWPLHAVGLATAPAVRPAHRRIVMIAKAVTILGG